MSQRRHGVRFLSPAPSRRWPLSHRRSRRHPRSTKVITGGRSSRSAVLVSGTEELGVAASDARGRRRADHVSAIAREHALEVSTLERLDDALTGAREGEVEREDVVDDGVAPWKCALGPVAVGARKPSFARRTSPRASMRRTTLWSSRTLPGQRVVARGARGAREAGPRRHRGVAPEVRASSGTSPVRVAQRRELDARDREAEEEIVAEAAARCTSRSRSRRVAAMTRTSTRVELARCRRAAPPIARARAAAWAAGRGRGRRSRRGGACRRGPARRRRGALRPRPVNAPRSWPKSADSTRLGGTAVQSKTTKGAARAGARSWSASASTSLPVPGLALDD